MLHFLRLLSALVNSRVVCFTVLFIAEIVWLTLGMIWVCTNYSTCPAKAPKRAVLGEYKPYFVNLAFKVDQSTHV